ncbi:quinoprotein relay system zinc metallohydrolase 1 [Thiothrix fructosivorans]|uniref:Quinoprotein relay system zinc metallohydrolase 1 n=1 Tax=Thiothrix fructosivorans TaxID=111770 RepID=A0A8B0SLT8_9GAMM|nr:quinoprotein relay system zinc metallohydrolase 1 [Thiothrix fructosivorans]MBO0612605.1 quinoprotein relay system zinc metallohydrolase 1 [Thiothrix fructosivorans]QTX11924.1 quinoprotein relay system zinc metallohydrolase 1 [Thiothrix fructosivorans]
MKRWLCAAFFISNAVFADDFAYPMQPQQVATDTYVIEGKTEDFSKKNGGFIVNTGFIVTADGVVVIDTGVSRRFGEQQRAAIEKLTGKKVVRVYITHHHPDHFLGNQTYTDVPIYALPATRDGIKAEGEMFSGNMYRMVGDWMRDTRVTPPTQDAKAGKETIGRHELEVLALQGHTAGDLALFDHTTGVLFSGDLVFNNRAATTPHATLTTWLTTLDSLQALSFKTLVPGHGNVASDTAPIAQTRAYLQWLQTTLKDAAANGLDMLEVMQTPIPADFQSVALVQNELRRSVSHLYPALEQANLKPAKQAE